MGHWDGGTSTTHKELELPLLPTACLNTPGSTQLARLGRERKRELPEKGGTLRHSLSRQACCFTPAPAGGHPSSSTRNRAGTESAYSLVRFGWPYGGQQNTCIFRSNILMIYRHTSWLQQLGPLQQLQGRHQLRQHQQQTSNHSNTHSSGTSCIVLLCHHKGSLGHRQ